MPYFWRPYWRRRRRRLWRRRARIPIRRRFWRRRKRRYTVRKKLSKITVKQWQPRTIKKLKITGHYCLYQGTRDRTGNNFNQWIASIAPEKFPGGGLMSIIRFSLNSLYELHRKARNWWTTSNCKLPLIRYRGCRLTFYRSTNTDYISVYSTCGDMQADLQTYQSTQPSILYLNKHKVIMTCTDTNRNKKPYKRKFIKPPALFENKWYFQRDIAKLPLLMLITSATSLNRWYVDSKAESNTIGFISLNTDFFSYHNFKNFSLTTGYQPNATFTLWTTHNNLTLKQTKYKHLIYLGNTKDRFAGLSLEQMTDTDPQKKVEEYFSKITNWGNPFFPAYFHPEYPNYYTTIQPLQTIKEKMKTNYDNVVENFTELQQDLFWNCRYNPENDLSHNGTYITDVLTKRTWQDPAKTEHTTEGLPLWLQLNGLIDFHQKAQDIINLMTEHILVITSDYISPKHDYYVVIDPSFLAGHSPYTDITRPSDEQYWFPKLNFQQETINTIIRTGPAAPKLPPDISTEAQVKYEFYFKLGGCPPPMDEVCDPNTRWKFPTPSNIISSTLLQSPETPIEWYLSSFDERRGFLTQKAAKRIKQDKDFTETMLDLAGQTTTEVPIRSPETSSDETSDSEKDQETLQLQFSHQRRKQRKLRKRILQLLNLLQE